MTYSQRLKGFSIMSKVFATLSLVCPLIVVPLLCYRFDNWWLLFGALFSLLGSFISMTKEGSGIVSLALVVCIGFWIKMGFNIHQYFTFFYFCFVAGFFCYRIMQEYNKKQAETHNQIQSLLFHEMTEGETGQKLQKEIDKLREQEWKTPE